LAVVQISARWITHFRRRGASAISISLLVLGVISLHERVLAISGLSSTSGDPTSARTTGWRTCALASVTGQAEMNEAGAAGAAEKTARIVMVHHGWSAAAQGIGRPTRRVRSSASLT